MRVEDWIIGNKGSDCPSVTKLLKLETFIIPFKTREPTEVWIFSIIFFTFTETRY